MDKKIEAVIINWKRPKNVSKIVIALRNQTVPCTITVCDCHPSDEFALSKRTLSKIDRIYRWTHNLGAFSRYVPLPSFDHQYTLFIDDDMLPGKKCLEYFLDCTTTIPKFGVLGQLGRIIDKDGIYRPRDITRTEYFIETDFIIRAYFTETKNLHHLLKFRWHINYFNEELPEDDLLLCASLKFYENLSCYLLPFNSDIETLVNKKELSTEYALSKRNNHISKRREFVKMLIEMGFPTVNSNGVNNNHKFNNEISK